MKLRLFIPGILLTAAFFCWNPATASAQFTLLPETKLDQASCKPILDEFMATGKVPAESELNEAYQEQDNKNYQSKLDAKKKAEEKVQTYEKKVEEAKKNVENVQKEYEQIINSCAGGGLAETDLSKCPGYDAVKQKLENAEKEVGKAANELEEVDKEYSDAIAESDKALDQSIEGTKGNSPRADLLGCAIKTGRISLTMIPYFITYIINFVLGLIGLVTVLFVVIGGYLYVFSGLSEDKDKGKKTITNALMGMGVALMAWAIVNIILRAITG